MIFFGSTDTFSASNTSRFIGPFLKWIHPEVTPETVRVFQMFIRKGWHVWEFFVLTLLLWFALGWTLRKGQIRNVGWSRRRALITCTGAVVYAMADEWHQSFRPTRGGAWSDVAIDSIGIGLAMLLLWLYYKLHSLNPLPRCREVHPD